MFVELLTGNGTYTANILSTPCLRVSVIKRLSLYEFAPKGRDFVSVVRIREGLYYRGIFQRKCMRILLVDRKLSVIERCPYQRGVRTEKFDCNQYQLIYITAKQVGKRGSSARRVFQGRSSLYKIFFYILAKCKILETALLEMCESKDLAKSFRGTARS